MKHRIHQSVDLHVHMNHASSSVGSDSSFIDVSSSPHPRRNSWRERTCDWFSIILWCSVVLLVLVNIGYFVKIVNRTKASMSVVKWQEDGVHTLPQLEKGATNPLNPLASFFPYYMNNRHEKMTVYMNTFDRDKLLKICLEHYAKLTSIVDRVIVSWNNIHRPPPDPKEYNLPLDIVFIRETEDSLNNRFKAHDDLIRTDAVLAVDDDIIIAAEDLDFALRMWRWFPDQIVGFTGYARTFSFNTTMKECRPNTKHKDYHYGNFCNIGSKRRFVNYDPLDYMLVLDSAVIFHRKYLKLYSIETDNIVKKHVTVTRNCEDISLPYIIALHSKLPAIMIDNYKDLNHMQYNNDPGKHVGISQTSSHYDLRTRCLNLYAERMFKNRMPLFRTTFKVSRVMYSDVKFNPSAATLPIMRVNNEFLYNPIPALDPSVLQNKEEFTEEELGRRRKEEIMYPPRDREEVAQAETKKWKDILDKDDFSKIRSKEAEGIQERRKKMRKALHLE